MMKNDLNYTEAAEILGVHRESVSNYVKRGLLKISPCNAKAVTMESVQNLLSQHRDIMDITSEVESMRAELSEEKKLLAEARLDVKDKIEYNRVKGITFQNIGYICDALLVYLDSFGDQLSRTEKKVVRAVLAHTDMSAVAEDIGLTHNRVREIYHKALRRLAHSERAKEAKEENKVLREQVELKNELIDSLKSSVAQLKHTLHIEELMSGKEESYLSVPAPWLQPISEAKLSVRATNCLNAADVEYVYELAFLSRYDLMKWRNFGRKSLNEVDVFKDLMGMSEERMTDVMQINDVPCADRKAVPFMVIEGKRRKWQKK